MPEPTEPRLFHLVHRLHQALFQAGDRMLVQELGITSSQSAVLMFLDKFKGASMGELASAVGLKITSVSGPDRPDGRQGVGPPHTQRRRQALVSYQSDSRWR